MSIAYSSYFDASGKYPRHPVVSVSGGIATTKKWATFERDWKRILRDEGLSEFHATDFASSLKEYKDWKGDTKRRSSFLKTLAAIIDRNVTRFFMVSVERDAWDAVNAEYQLEENFHSPYALAGFSVVIHAMKWAKSREIKSPIEFIFEDGDEGWSGLRQLCSPDQVTPIRLPKEKAVPCQLGDLLAWKNRIAATNSLKLLSKVEGSDIPDIQSFNQIFTEMESLNKILTRPGTPLVYGPKSLLKTCKGSRVPKRSSVIPKAIKDPTL